MSFSPSSLFNRGKLPVAEQFPSFTARTDLQWGRRLFQPPALPTPSQRMEAMIAATTPRPRPGNPAR